MKIVIAALHHPERYLKRPESYFRIQDGYSYHQYAGLDKVGLSDAKQDTSSMVEVFLSKVINQFAKHEVTEVIILTDFNLGYSGTLFTSIPALNTFMNSFQDIHGQQFKAQNKCTMNSISSPAASSSAASAAPPSYIPVTFYFEGANDTPPLKLEKDQWTKDRINGEFGNPDQLYLVTYLSTLRKSSSVTPSKSTTPSSSTRRLQSSVSPPIGRPIPSALSFSSDGANSSGTPSFSTHEGSAVPSSYPSHISASASPLSRVASANLGSISVPSNSFSCTITPMDKNDRGFDYPRSVSQFLDSSKSPLPNVDEELKVINQSVPDESGKELHPEKNGLGEETIVAFSRVLQISDIAAIPAPLIATSNPFGDLVEEQERLSPPPSQLHRFSFIAKPVPTRPVLIVEVNDNSSILSSP